jgi:hypothetical protein
MTITTDQLNAYGLRLLAHIEACSDGYHNAQNTETANYWERRQVQYLVELDDQGVDIATLDGLIDRSLGRALKVIDQLTADQARDAEEATR